DLDKFVELPGDVMRVDDDGDDSLYEPSIPDDDDNRELPEQPPGEISNEELQDLMEVDAEPINRVPEGVASAFVNRFEHQEAIGNIASAAQVAGDPDGSGEIIVELGGGLVKVQRPCASRDDVTEVELDLGLTYEGMVKELKALESLAVGDMMWHVDPKQRVISTRWVVAAKTERVEGKETPLVRCRIVARDYSTGPSAAQLGISSPTASAEALKLFLAVTGAKGLNILGGKAFLETEQSPLRAAFCRPALDTTPGRSAQEALWDDCVSHGTVFVRWVLYKGKPIYVLSYVDDLLLAGVSTEDLYEMVESLRKELKLKVTADLAKDGKIHFLGREIFRSEQGGDLKFGMDPGYMKDAAARYRRALGKLSWLSTTRGDLVYYVSVLARGQSSPQEVHERAMRAVLRYLKTVVNYFQLFPRQEEKELKLHSYVDASWGSERSVDRRSISGGCLMLGKACVKTWARLQQSVALSSAESELYALVEGAKEALGARCAVEHILGCDPVVPLLYCDSEAAVAISHAEGLRKLRHIDLRSCFLQQEVQSQSLRVVSVRGTDNPADIFTKNLDLSSTLRHMHHIGLCSTLLPEGVKGYGAEYQKHLDGLWAVHRKLWAVVRETCDFSDHWAIEWPVRCAYWTWKQTKHYFTLQKYPIHETLVDACSVGLQGCDGLPVSKRWRVMVTHDRAFKDAMVSFSSPSGQ
ncbi:RE2, partial [Symbiodinium sp. CCMP2456]